MLNFPDIERVNHQADFATWARGWHDMVYTDASANPDITLGELLLVYFEWMSVYKVTSLSLLSHLHVYIIKYSTCALSTILRSIAYFLQ